MSPMKTYNQEQNQRPIWPDIWMVLLQLAVAGLLFYGVWWFIGFLNRFTPAGGGQ